MSNSKNQKNSELKETSIPEIEEKTSQNEQNKDLDLENASKSEESLEHFGQKTNVSRSEKNIGDVS